MAAVSFFQLLFRFNEPLRRDLTLRDVHETMIHGYVPVLLVAGWLVGAWARLPSAHDLGVPPTRFSPPSTDPRARQLAATKINGRIIKDVEDPTIAHAGVDFSLRAGSQRIVFEKIGYGGKSKSPDLSFVGPRSPQSPPSPTLQYTVSVAKPPVA
ncbi:hypothetical protein C8R44DRAFT_882818 [Mycena epipterygia]|nr:hypothetical protein C8R44DRAFT_882818 [Mycena epipterygia]